MPKLDTEEYNKKLSQYGTEEISEGRLTGTTDTDYFYFLCIGSAGNGQTEGLI